jgi:hypothetical protein
MSERVHFLRAWLGGTSPMDSTVSRKADSCHSEKRSQYKRITDHVLKSLVFFRDVIRKTPENPLAWPGFHIGLVIRSVQSAVSA